MSRDRAIESATAYFSDGRFLSDLRNLISIRSESQNPQSRAHLTGYLECMQRIVAAMGLSCRIFPGSVAGSAGFLLAERIEDESLPTVLMYGHGDVVSGMEGKWSEGLDPWSVTVVDGKWFGRGVADNKGQHWINLVALKILLEDEGHLGFNFRFLLEMGEEIGSPGLHEFCRQQRQALRSDVLLASDGPRLSAGRPTIFMGSRGIAKFSLRARVRKKQYHSGNWGGVLKDPAIRLVHAISSITDANGRILIDCWRPSEPAASIRQALADCEIAMSDDDGIINSDWGEVRLTPSERLYAWNSFSVLAMQSGDVTNPVNVIQSEAVAVCQLRFVVGLNPQSAIDCLRRHLDANGFEDIAIEWDSTVDIAATRLDPSHPCDVAPRT